MEFYIDDHAILFGLLAREICLTYPKEDGQSLIKELLILMSRELGLRMAMRCRRDEKEADTKNYFLYGEWSDEKGWNRSEIVSYSPVFQRKTLSCGWCKSWEEMNLLPYGRTYCEWVDENLLFGFNPSLQLKMGTPLSFGNDCCEFFWVDCSLSEEEYNSLMQQRSEMIEKVTKDFLYHTAHLYSAAKRTLLLRLGLFEGERILNSALSSYAEHFGEEKKRTVIEAAKQDFLEL